MMLFSWTPGYAPIQVAPNKTKPIQPVYFGRWKNLTIDNESNGRINAFSAHVYNDNAGDAATKAAPDKTIGICPDKGGIGQKQPGYTQTKAALDIPIGIRPTKAAQDKKNTGMPKQRRHGTKQPGYAQTKAAPDIPIWICPGKGGAD
jgi:hypothetical protein